MALKAVTVEELKALTPDQVKALVAEAGGEAALVPAFKAHVQAKYDKVDKSADDNFDDAIVVDAIVGRFTAALERGVDDTVIEGTETFTAFEALAAASQQ